MAADPGLRELEAAQNDFDFDDGIDIPNPTKSGMPEEAGESKEADRPKAAPEGKEALPPQAPPVEGPPPTEFDDLPGDDIPPDSGQKAEGESQGPQFDEGLLRAAGIDRDTAAKHFRTAEELEAALRWQDAQALQAGRTIFQQQQLRQQQQWLPPQQQQQPPQQRQQLPPPAEDEFKLELNPEEWGEETVALLQKMHGFYTQKISKESERGQKLEQVLVGMHNRMQEQAQESWLDEFDNRCSTLPEHYREAFGEGDRRTLNPDSKPFQSRVRLNQAMQAISHGRQSQGLPPLDASQLFDRALRAEFPELTEHAVRQDTANKLTKRFAQTTARPTSRQGTPLTAEQKASERVRQFFAQKGMTRGAIEEPDGV